MAYDTLKERGFVAQVTDEAALRELLQKPTTVYIGYDPTADSLHVGNLFTLMALAHFERAGHRGIALMGGGTAMVGDPSGKTEMRQMLTPERIAQNLVALRGQVGRILNVERHPLGHMDGVPEPKSLIVDNADWLLALNYIEFLREVGKHFSVNRMLSAESYKQRLEKGLSFIEFNYQLLQAYDFVELRRRYDCRVQMGGDDQWGNILAGVDLARRMDGELVHGLTFPLVMTAQGEKMGKTAAGAVWLSADKVSPYDFYQYWVSTHDADVARFLAYFTFLPMDEIRAAAAQGGASINLQKSVLAFESTAIVHGRDAALAAHKAAMAGFGGREIPRDLLPSSGVPRSGVADIEEMPTHTIVRADLPTTVLIDVLVTVGLTASKGEGRRLIKQGAVKLGDARVDEELRTLTAADFTDGAVLLRVGKKKLYRLVLAE